MGLQSHLEPADIRQIVLETFCIYYPNICY